jgi:flavin reductase (DIM6/NTAB) family NADH-FMN oxidoreductase RutF
MFYEPAKRNHGLPHDPFKAIVAPRPIGWVTSMSGKGDVNLSPYSFFNAVCEHPHMVAFSSNGWKDAAAFIDESKEFVCSVATYAQREQMNVTSAPYERGIDEMVKAGLEAAPSRLVKPPRVAGAPAAMECKCTTILRLEALEGQTNHYLIIGQVVGIWIDDAFIENGFVDTAAMRIIARAGYHEYFVADTKFAMKRPTVG